MGMFGKDMQQPQTPQPQQAMQGAPGQMPVTVPQTSERSRWLPNQNQATTKDMAKQALLALIMRQIQSNNP